MRSARKQNRLYRIVKEDAAMVLLLEPSNTEAALALGFATWQLGTASAARANLRYCLRLDPDAVDCLRLYRLIVAQEQALALGKRLMEDGNYASAAAAYLSGVSKDQESPLAVDISFRLCAVYAAMGPQDRASAVEWCMHAVDTADRQDPSASQRLAEAFLTLSKIHFTHQDVTLALHFLVQAISFDDGTLRTETERLRVRIEHAEYQHKRKDYYRILEVERNATAKDIRRSYRRLAFKWHPDRWATQTEKEAAAAKFQEIAEAYSILSDPDIRAKYDAGWNIQEEIRNRASKQQQRQQEQSQRFSRREGFANVTVDPRDVRRGEATVRYVDSDGVEFEVRVAFDGRALAEDHCCIEWPGEW
eukprot:NODE_1283_length_1603_cov_28.529601_g1148_i0.p1 GENE.NODE_1283_length_1603_cov_28.529601_g1148_i0~~NODE_1283_length_1603_cov_28.529601_g1148_i0.p1  ORF type:complete len:362 (+),score=70.59 NODE_1283_length_1603_cov_28.529601_g1148_i0:342-1427(+)